jgi:spore coat polysaccharide biosynthesis protein SpsF (cytidylyltransferase family)
VEYGLNTLLITQARTGSTRLPGKVLLKVKGEELLKIHLDRLSNSRLTDGIIVATTVKKEDDVIVNLCKNWNVSCYRGSEEDVLDRFYQVAKDLKPKWVVRVTSDCPLIDPVLIDALISFAQTNEVDYCSNGIIERYPDGQDVEVFKYAALEHSWKEASLKSEREHVTPYIRNHSDAKGGHLFKVINFPCIDNFTNIRMTVDEDKDFQLIEKLINELGTDASWLTYTNYIIKNGLDKINDSIVRNEGYLKSLKKD